MKSDLTVITARVDEVERSHRDESRAANDKLTALGKENSDLTMELAVRRPCGVAHFVGTLLRCRSLPSVVAHTRVWYPL